MMNDIHAHSFSFAIVSRMVNDNYDVVKNTFCSRTPSNTELHIHT